MRRLGLVGQPWDILEENHVTSGVALSFASTRRNESTNSEGGNFAMASLSYYQGGEWTNFPYSSEPRKPRIKAQGLVQKERNRSL